MQKKMANYLKNIGKNRNLYYRDSENIFDLKFLFYLKKVDLNLVFLILLVLAIYINPTLAQNSVSPVGSAPGSPAGSYLLSNVETINLYSGKVNAVVPLLQVGGRGSAGYTMMWQIDDASWTTKRETNNGYTAVYALNEPEEIGFVPPLKPFEFGIVKMRYTATDPGCPSPDPDGPLTCFRSAATTMIFISADGTEHPLFDEVTGGWASQLQHPYNTYEWSPSTERGLVFSAKDGSGLTFVSDPLPYGQSQYYAKTMISEYESFSPGFQEEKVNGYLKQPNGTVVRFENSRAQWIRDRNGNKTTFHYEAIAGNDVRLNYVTDSNNRMIDIVYGTTSNYQQIVYKGTNGASRTITINYDILQNRLRPNSGYGITTIAGLFPAYPQYGSTNTFDNGSGTFNPGVVSGITLPDNRAYNFYYNSYGELARLESPTGAAIEYDYAAGLDQDPNDPTLPNGFLPSGQVGKITSYPSRGPVGIYRRLLERREYANSGSTSILKTTYSRYDKTVGKVREDQLDAVTNTVIGRSDHYFNGLPYLGVIGWTGPQIGIGDLLEGREIKTENLDVTTNSVLSRTEYLWNAGCGNSRAICEMSQYQPYAWSPFIERITTSILDTSTNQYKVAKKEFKYDKYDNQTDVYDYDYDNGQAGIFKRRTHTDFVTDTNYTSETGSHLRSLPLQTWVSSDIAGNTKRSLTQFEYDNYSSGNNAPLDLRSNVVGHDTTNFGTNYTRRGNVTKVTAYGNAQNQTEPVSVYSNYDILGNVVKKIDAKNYATIIDYTDRFGSPDGEARANTSPTELGGLSTFAFATSSTNPLGWVTGYSQVDYYTGQSVDVEDINGVVSSMFYEDLLDRPTKSITANNQPNFRWQIIIDYDDNIINRKVTILSDLNGFNDQKLKSESFYDGLGRTIETRKYEADGGYIASKSVPFLTMQDPETGIWRAGTKTSNPYRPNTGEQPIWTTSLSDSIGRGIKVITPDGAIVKTAYSGNIVTVTDQAGKQRRSITNALGHLTRVDEPDNSGDLGSISSPKQPTDYTYDVLNNLLTVSQIGTSNEQCGSSTTSCSQTRTFEYDSLSRLKSATNPESGIIHYIYDNNGNLTTKTDARNVVTTYIYDALNRVTNRNYSAPNPAPQNYQASPNVTYTYDDLNIANSKGKLTRVAAIVGSTVTSETQYQAFDIMGRIKQSQQWVDGVSYGVPMTYTYNLTGALIEQKYPSGRVVKNVLDTDGDLSIVQSKKNQSSGYWNYADSFTYTAAGAVSSMQLGNGKWESTSFNSRLQPTQIALGTVQNGTDKLKLNFTYNTPNQNDNNGNVLSQTITVPQETINNQTYAAFTATQTYSYDSLNRIKEAKEMIGTNQEWRQTFTYDRYGNRRFDTGTDAGGNKTTTLAPGCATAVCNPTIDPNTNKLVGYQFDDSGNTKVDAENRQFIYDGENKQVEVKNSNNVSLGKYFYDGDGKRVKKISATETTIFIYNAGGQLVAEYSPQIAQGTNAKVSYLTNDHLGSPRTTTDANGQVISRRDFQPFGEEIQRAGYGADSVRQKFTSYERDIETELDFAQARMYSSKLGRFNSADPLYIELRRLNDPQQINLYSYTRNNPLKFTDPTGLDIEVRGETTDDYINRLQQNVSFKINRNSTTGKVQIVDANGDVLDKKALKKLGKSLTNKAEKALFKAITDTKNHAVINTVRESGDVDFGHFDGNGQNTIDSSDLAALDNSSDNAGFTAAHVVGHETLEAYHSAKKKTTLANMNKSHNYANKFFAGIEPVADQSSATFTVNNGGNINNYSASNIPNSGAITHVSSVFNIQGTSRNIRIEKQFISPIPVNAIPSSLPSHHIVDVRREP